jgi:hypothetical protein
MVDQGVLDHKTGDAIRARRGAFPVGIGGIRERLREGNFDFTPPKD